MPRLLPEVTTSNVVKMIAAVVTLSFVAAAFVTFANYDRRVTLDVDGNVTEVRTSAETVGELLESKNVKIGEKDKLSVSPDAKIAKNDRIEVRTAKPLTLIVDGKKSKATVHDWNVADALKTLEVEPSEGAELSAGLDDRITNKGLQLVVSNPKKITLRVDGKKHKTTTAAMTVADVLANFKVELDEDDELSHGLGTYLKPGQALRVVRIEKVRREVEGNVKFAVKYKNDSSLYEGETKVVTLGKLGKELLTVDLVLADGVERERVVVSRNSVREPIVQVEKRGTKKRPVEAGDSVWDKLAQCESGGNWHINTGNGYYGGLQFSLGTWRAVGGSGYPHENSREEQIKRGKILQARSGWGQWPACTARLGLR